MYLFCVIWGRKCALKDRFLLWKAICTVKGKYLSWRGNAYHGRRICVVKGGYVPQETLCHRRRLFTVDYEFVSLEAFFVWKANLFVIKNQYFVRGDCLPGKAFLCLRMRICAVEDDFFVVEGKFVCHWRRVCSVRDYLLPVGGISCGRRICVVGGDFLPWKASFCHERIMYLSWKVDM